MSKCDITNINIIKKKLLMCAHVKAWVVVALLGRHVQRRPTTKHQVPKRHSNRLSVPFNLGRHVWSTNNLVLIVFFFLFSSLNFHV